MRMRENTIHISSYSPPFLLAPWPPCLGSGRSHSSGWPAPACSSVRLRSPTLPLYLSPRHTAARVGCRIIMTSTSTSPSTSPTHSRHGCTVSAALQQPPVMERRPFWDAPTHARSIGHAVGCSLPCWVGFCHLPSELRPLRHRFLSPAGTTARPEADHPADRRDRQGRPADVCGDGQGDRLRQ